MEKIKDQRVKPVTALEFLNIGLACHAICLLEDIGALSKLSEGETLERLLESVNNPALMHAALVTLIESEIIKLYQKKLVLTKFGKSIVSNIGTLQLPFRGYHKLLGKQYELIQKPEDWSDKEIDYRAIALSSINFGEKYLDPLLIDLFKYLHPKGTICDLGCGTGEKLVKICEATKTNGLGIEKDPKVIEKSKQFTENSSVEIIRGDISRLRGVWEDVEVGLISFVLHDLNPAKSCARFLRSLRRHFPRMRCLIVVDIVTFSEETNSIMPGFDYVHGLQGVLPRNRQESLDVFSEASYVLRQEMKVEKMPNTLVWVLETK